MSSPQFAAVPAAFIRKNATLIAANGTAAKPVVDVLAAAAQSATTPLYYGGGTLIEMSAVNAAASAVSLQLWNAEVLTTVGGATGASTTTASTVTRAAGSFITDGFRVGQIVMIFAPSTEAPNAAVDGIPGVITTVAALQLTVNSTPFAALSLVTGSRICSAAPKHVSLVAASAGTSATVRSADLLHVASGDGYLERAEWKLGINNILAVAATVAVPALPAYVAIEAAVARY